MKEEGVYDTVNRKRDNIVKELHACEVPPEYEEARRRMENYLHSQKKRCTIERRFILQALYQLDSPVDIETLHDIVCRDKGMVSLTTVYNTLQLLVELKLAKRLELVSHGMTFFEKTLGQEPHGYVICEQCGAISVIAHPEVFDLFKGQLPKGFLPDDFTLHIHGLCQKCQRENRKNRKKKKKSK